MRDAIIVRHVAIEFDVMKFRALREKLAQRDWRIGRDDIGETVFAVNDVETGGDIERSSKSGKVGHGISPDVGAEQVAPVEASAV